MKKVFLYVLTVITLALCSIGSFAFLVSETPNKDNTISTGTFPKFKVKIYSAAGPVFKGTFPGQQNQESISYPTWLTDASRYILKDLTGQGLEGPLPKNEYETYTNIPDGSVVSRKNTIISANFYSWKGVSLDKHEEEANKETGEDKQDEKQHGTIIHHIVVIENSNRYGKGSPKIKLSELKLDDITVSIEQYDVFKGDKGEYKVPRKDGTLLIGSEQNRTRVRTFDLKNGKYVRTFKNNGGQNNNGGNQSSNGEHPADEADLIIFDVGTDGYCTETNNKGQQALDEVYKKLCGNGHATLEKSVCEVKLIKGDTVISKEVNTVKFGE